MWWGCLCGGNDVVDAAIPCAAMAGSNAAEMRLTCGSHAAAVEMPLKYGTEIQRIGVAGEVASGRGGWVPSAIDAFTCVRRTLDHANVSTIPT